MKVQLKMDTLCLIIFSQNCLQDAKEIKLIGQNIWYSYLFGGGQLFRQQLM